MNSDLASISEEIEDACDRRNISDENEIRSDEEHSLGCTPMSDTPPFSVCDQLYSWTPSIDPSVVPDDDDDAPPMAKRMKADLEKPSNVYPQSSITGRPDIIVYINHYCIKDRSVALIRFLCQSRISRSTPSSSSRHCRKSKT